jgi:hypothetical protein
MEVSNNRRIDKTHTFTNRGITSLNNLMNLWLIHTSYKHEPTQHPGSLPVTVARSIGCGDTQAKAQTSHHLFYLVYILSLYTITSWKHHHTNIHSNIHNVPLLLPTGQSTSFSKFVTFVF